MRYLKIAKNDDESTPMFYKKIPIILWVVCIVSIIIPIISDFIFRGANPKAIFLLYIIPIIIFVIFLPIKNVLFWTLILNSVHIASGILYQFLFHGNLISRIYNHLGLTFFTFAVAILLGKIFTDLKESESRYRSVVELSPQMIVIHKNGIINYVNPAAIELAGVKYASQLIGKSIFDFIHPENEAKAKYRNRRVLEGNRGNDFIEYKMVRIDGEIRYLELLGSKINYNNEPAILVVGRDVTQQKEYQKQIEFMAYHDALTLMPNRFYLKKYFEENRDRFQQQNIPLAVMFIDLDRFKFINDTVGHELGDELLVQVSKRLTNVVKEDGIVVRQGGDEFLILLLDSDATKTELMADRVLNCFHIPFILMEEEYYISPSIGISVYADNGYDINTLIKHADTAMYKAKKYGKNNYQFYTNEDEDSMIRNVKLERGLVQALHNKEFKLKYQPIVDINTGNISSFEVLLRWNHPELGYISPTEFIPIAEETGLIIPLGNWVLKEACKQHNRWVNEGFENFSIAVNVSAIQFEDNRFLQFVEESLSKYKVPDGRLILEITESVMQNIKHSSLIINNLNKLGVKVSIDDFGTGYSSLSVLNKLPIDFVKIDKSFIKDALNGPNTASLIKTMIEMGGNLNINIVAEGIENQEQADFLMQNSCQLGQGYLYSPPLSVAEVEDLLKRYS